MSFRVALGIMLACFAGAATAGAPEPRNGPRTVSEWIAALGNQEATGGARRYAAEMLGEMGPAAAEKAVPALIPMLEDRQERVRLPAVNALVQFGPAALSAVPHLIERFKDQDSDVRQAALVALLRIGPGAATELLNATRHEDSEMRASALLALVAMQPRVKGLEPHLEAGLKDKELSVRIFAAEAAWRYSRDAKPVLPIVIEGLKSEEQQIRLRSLVIVSLMKETAKPAIPDLIQFLARSKGTEVDACFAILSRFGGDAIAAVPIYLQLAVDPQDRHGYMDLRRFGAEVIPLLAKAIMLSEGTHDLYLNLLDDFGPRAVPSLSAYLDDPNAGRRALAARTLVELHANLKKWEKSGRDIVLQPSEKKVFETAFAKAFADLKVRVYGAAGLVAMGLDGKEARRLLLDIGPGADKELRLFAVETVAQFTNDKAAAVAYLREAMKDGDAEIRSHAVYRGHSLLVKSPLAVRELIQSLKDADDNMFNAAVHLLCFLPTANKEDFECLVECFLTGSGIERQLAMVICNIKVDADVRAKAYLRILLHDDEKLKLIRESVILQLGSDWKMEVRDAGPIIDALKTAEERHVLPLVRLLEAVGLAAKPAIPELMKRFADGDEKLKAAVMVTLTAIGAEAVPELRKLIAHSDADVRLRAAYALARWPAEAKHVWSVMIEDLRSGNSKRELEGLRLARTMGPCNPTALREMELILARDEPNTRLDALLTIIAMGPAALPQLRDAATRHPYQTVRLVAAKELRKYPGDFHTVRTVAVKLLTTGTDAYQTAALELLSDLGGAAAEDADSVIPLLRDREDRFRELAATTLGRMGPQVKDKAGPALRGLLRDGAPEVRSAAAVALSRVDRTAVEAIPILLQEVKSFRGLLPPRRVHGGVGPGARGGNFDNALPALLIAFQTENILESERIPSTDNEVLEALARFGSAAVPGLIDLLEREQSPQLVIDLPSDWGGRTPRYICDPYSRHNAVSGAMEVLGRIGPEAREAIPALLRLTQRPDSDSCLDWAAREAIAVVRRIDPANNELIRLLVERLNRFAADPWMHDPDDYLESLKVLTDIGSTAKDAMCILLKRIEQGGGSPSRLEAVALWRIDGRSEPLVDGLRRELEVELAKPSDRRRVYHELDLKIVKELGPRAKALLPLLVKLLRLKGELPEGVRGDTDIRTQAIEALGWIGPDAKAALPEVRSALKSKNPFLRVSAAYALWQIGGPPKEAVPVIIKAITPSEPGERYLDDCNIERAGMLGRMGGDAVDAVPALKAMRMAENPLPALAVAAALARIQPRCEDGVPFLIQQLTNSSPKVRAAAATQLGKLGRLAKEGARALNEMSDDDDSEVRAAVRMALQKIGEAH